jgi:tRNA pseudouridine32 synthase/23S rRNA pseudouridine746 synthase
MNQLRIVFENESFIIVDKPPCTLSVPSSRGEKETRSCVGLMLQEFLKQQIYPVHRLDFEVGGLLLFAKNQTAHRVANRWFETKLIKKNYQALTPLTDKKYQVGDSFSWEYKLAQGKKRTFEAAYGADTLTEALVQKIENQVVTWKLSPITGKRHQLRVVLYLQGHPIIGDILYNSLLNYDQPGIALTAIELDLSGIKDSERMGLPSLIRKD